MSDETWMERALTLARRALGSTSPNPAVGALIVREGRVLGEGYTHPPGGPHAEVVALRDAADAGHDVAGATMYVTLEPCCHWGRTPPCTDAIVAAGIQRVVVGVVDPFGPMRGRGLERLRGAGIEVAVGAAAEACARAVLGFTRAVTRGLPEVTAKIATSLDGRIATSTGQSRWITGEEARAHGHGLRAEHDAILVGIGTILADDPRLTCRHAEGADPVPLVLDTALRIPGDAAVFRSSRRPVIFCAEDAPVRELPADVVRVGRAAGGLDVEAALREAASRGLHRVLVEGGAAVHRSLLDRGLVDTLLVYLAGTILPGGVSWVGGPPVGELSAAPRFGRPDVRLLGADVLLAYQPTHPTEGV